MNQVLAIQHIKEKIKNALDGDICPDPAIRKKFLEEICDDLDAFLANGIDYKVVVDMIDDSIFISDAKGKCLYVNPAYQRNTTITPDEVVGRYVSDIVKEGKLFTGGATMDVIKTGEKVFRLSTVYKTQPPTVGYTVGVPVFDSKGKLKQVIVTSRPIITLKSLHEDFDKFLSEANSVRDRRENVEVLENSDHSSVRMIGSSPSLQKIYRTVEIAAPTNATVLITGESGAGKEVVADEIHRLSPRSGKTFVKVNCASIPDNLLESELFGYEKGAFSGANANGKQGLFEIANGGTLLLDEIGSMPMDLQVKLLRAIQHKEITRVGGTKPIKLDIRIISATNGDLKKQIADGTFRQDLYYRLNVIPIYVPPLRERLDDLEELCEHFVKQYNQMHDRQFALTDEAIDIMKRYNWPGNIRELENVIEYLTICSVSVNESPEKMLQGLLDIAPAAEETGTFSSGTLSQSLDNYEKSLIESALSESKSLRDAGAKLGVNASTISRKIKQYGIEYHAGK